jgi:two-component sensor histidine kinase
MALHESTTNALRHGALAEPGPKGWVLRWNWNEQDGLTVAPPARHGSGCELSNRVLVAQAVAEGQVA